MKRNLLTIVLLACCSLASAQSDNFKFDWHGFVNPHFYADSRQVVGGREEMMLFYPKPAVMDSIYDLNDGWSMNMLSITARINLMVTGPELLGAKTKAFVEGDFTGSTNATNNNLRLRHAYIDLDWGHSDVLAGQYWYPMVVPEIMPNTRPLNMGAPFHPYARYSQLRYTARFADHWEALLAALFQQDNMSQGMIDGVKASSTQFIRRSCVPEMHLQVRYNSPRLFAGAAANMLTIQPRIYTASTSGNLLGYKENFTSLSYTIFFKYRWNGWALSAQTLLNNNLYEDCTMGGYMENFAYNAANGLQNEDYSAWHFNTVWADLGQTSGKWRTGLFVGYGQNMAFGQECRLADNVFGRGFDMEYLWRVQPRIGYHASDKFNIYAEAEYTFAQYGKKITDSGVKNYHYQHDDNGGVGNLRLMLSAEYRW